MQPKRRVFEVPYAWIKLRKNGKPARVKTDRGATLQDADFRRVLAGKMSDTRESGRDVDQG